MVKFKLIVCLLFSVSYTFSQCDLTQSGIGDFEGDIMSDWSLLTNNQGAFIAQDLEVNQNISALQVNVSEQSPWQVRLFNKSECQFSLQKDSIYTISVYVKGAIGKTFGISLLNGNTTLDTKDLQLTSSDWKLYFYSFKSPVSSSTGGMRIHFEDVAPYYIDNLALNSVDCNGVESGAASVDSCGVCAGGNTNIIPNNCGVHIITPDDVKLSYKGVLESEITSDRATLYRLLKDYATTSVAGYYTSKRAAGSAGISICFKTASPTVQAFFEENLTYADDLFNHNIAIYKNGAFQRVTNDFTLSLSNSSGESVTWELVMPTYTQMDFLKLEVSNGFDLENRPTIESPKYIAIGNSITNGLGTTGNSSHLTYPFLVKEELGYELFNWGVGGSKVYDGLLANLSTGITPELVTVLWGYNDVHFSGNDQYLKTNTFPQYAILLDSICSTFPDANVVAILPTYTTDPYNTAHRNIDSLRVGELKIIEELQKKYGKLFYINGADYTDASSLNDDVHLNNSGHEALANAVLNKVSLILPTAKREVSQLTIFPNPVQNVLSLSKVESWKLLDAQHNLLKSGRGDTIEMSDLENGLYFVVTPIKTVKLIKD